MEQRLPEFSSSACWTDKMNGLPSYLLLLQTRGAFRSSQLEKVVVCMDCFGRKLGTLSWINLLFWYFKV